MWRSFSMPSLPRSGLGLQEGGSRPGALRRLARQLQYLQQQEQEQQQGGRACDSPGLLPLIAFPAVLSSTRPTHVCGWRMCFSR